MKKNVGIKNSDIQISSDLASKKLSRNAIPPAKISEVLTFFGSISLMDKPSLLKKPCSLSKVTFCTSFVRSGTQIIARSGDIKEYSPITIPKLINEAKVKFQRLSLFIRDSVELTDVEFDITTYLFFKNYISLILAYIRLLSKGICRICLMFGMFLFGCVAYADDLEVLIKKAEVEYKIPDGLLASIARIESDNKPYAICIDGKPFYGKDKKEALSVVNKSLSQGISNIDIGIMQINWHWHGESFSNIDQMLTPENNIKYAAGFLKGLHKKHGSWSRAVRHYHSPNSNRQKVYANKILMSWID